MVQENTFLYNIHKIYSLLTRVLHPVCPGTPFLICWLLYISRSCLMSLMPCSAATLRMWSSAFMWTSIFTASLIRSLSRYRWSEHYWRRSPASSGVLLLLGAAPLQVRDAQAAAVQRVGQMGEVAAQGLQLGQRLLAFQPGEPGPRQTLHHLEGRQKGGVTSRSPPTSQL